jgi:peptidyl-prolyl cis-trans isomerase C
MQVLVRIGDQAITRGDVDRRLAELPEQYRANYSTPEGRKQLLDRMVEERTWMVAAEQAGVPARPQLQRQLEQQKRDLILRTYVNEVMAGNPAPSDAEALAYYEQHQSEYRSPAQVTLRHIQTRTEADGKKVLAAVKKGEDWDKLVTRSSTDSTTRTQGGQLGTVTRDGLFASLGRQPALAESAFALGEGRTGGPYRTDKGWSVIRVDAVREESVRPFEQVRPGIVRQMSATRQQTYYQAQLDSIRRALGVSPDSAAIKDFLSAKRSARDIFKEAQEAGPVETRLGLYRQVVEEYPDSDVAPQAQFMIGFIHSEEVKDYEKAEAAFRELLRRYPKSELASSAQWMIDHMRTEEAPPFLEMGADSAVQGVKPGGEQKP